MQNYLNEEETAADVASIDTKLGDPKTPAQIKKMRKKENCPEGVKSKECSKITEGVIGLFYIYKIVKQLLLPFNKWDIYKDGIIDDKGNIQKGYDIKKLDLYNRILLMIKKVLLKFVKNKPLTLAILYSLITEEITSYSIEKYKEQNNLEDLDEDIIQDEFKKNLECIKPIMEVLNRHYINESDKVLEELFEVYSKNTEYMLEGYIPDYPLYKDVQVNKKVLNII